MPTRRTLLAFLVASLAVGCATPPTTVEDAYGAAQANLKTPEGQKYDREFEAQTSPRFESAVKSCLHSLGRPDRSQTSLLFRIDASGRPVETLLDPETKIGACVRDGIAGFTLPPPPAPDYWVIIQLNFKT
jgi:hypothetical protein